ncbi:alpha/beta hydrolase [Psychromarinibacter halotolerans]|uniref:Alpha/beta hydrolase n=1 Tax=Psychromarinibacter halotolerans TaxID=1775175 RepID=A0ABV7GT71_9RHOB|nr:alpha/beta hydrolase [Psychromarinibacter halotolerans]MDF0597266.1 alpha/beta hydrolase [Psychromarinibacter halotolerans]
MSTPAPFFQEVAKGPDNVRALWVTARDGARLRIALWPGGTRGTVLLFPGRTEYVEKYGIMASELESIGLSTIAIDWRGQGLADRSLEDRATGHVGDFTDYQHDVAAMLSTAREQGLPEPYFLIAHSMGGCIGLRAVLEHLPVKAAVFTGPMWGIKISRSLRPVAWVLSWAARKVGHGYRYVPGTSPDTYVTAAMFEDNLLTTDPGMFEYMTEQLRAHPDLALGGPSLHWLYEALIETRRLARQPSPDLPCLTFLGTNERIVDTAAVHARMAMWPKGRLQMVEAGEHEVMMEGPDARRRLVEDLDRFWFGDS